jgi:predicted Zn-dependent peptidase
VAAPDRAQVPANGAPPALQVPAQQHFQLANGLKVRLVEYHRLPIVALDLVLGAGAVHDPVDRPGLASFTADMLTEGTRTRTATQISDQLGAIGAQLGAGAGFDSAQVSGTVLSSHLDALLELLADVAISPSFPQADFARVQDERLVALVQQRDVPRALAAKAFAHAFWGKHPYGHWIMGSEQSVGATTRGELSRFHDQFWRPQNAELVVVGDVSEAQLQAMLGKTLARWTPGAAQAGPTPVARPTGKKTLLIEKRRASQTFLMMGAPGPERAAPDFAAAQVAFQILGGGSASRLFRSLREEHGYTYGIYARAEARRLGGTSFILGSVKADVTGLALEELLAQVAAIRDQPVSQAELEGARASIALELPAAFATASGIASKLAEEVAYGLPDDYWDRYAADVMKVTVSDVQRAAQKYLDLDALVTVMVGDAAQVQPQLQSTALGAAEVRVPAAE